MVILGSGDRAASWGKVMAKSPGRLFLSLLGLACIVELTAIVEAAAYIDPGTTGLVSQILYVLFYGALAAVFYFLRPIKEYLNKAKQFFARLLGRVF